MSLPKPVMRGMLVKRMKILLPLGFVGCVGLVLMIKLMYNDPRKRDYDRFYKEYDSVKEFNAMREAGVFESVQPIGK